MRRIWFKRAMREAILAGKKTATTRTHRIPLGEVRAVSGSRFAVEPFAVLKITSNDEATWEDILANFKAEGFDSRDEMVEYVGSERLPYRDAPVLYLHRFKVVPP